MASGRYFTCSLCGRIDLVIRQPKVSPPVELGGLCRQCFWHDYNLKLAAAKAAQAAEAQNPAVVTMNPLPPPDPLRAAFLAQEAGPNGVGYDDGHPGKYLPPAVTVAAFSFTPASPTRNQPVLFTDASTFNPTSWSWNFGDGATSTTRHPSHSYATAATFTVTLTVTNIEGTDSVSHDVTVS